MPAKPPKPALCLATIAVAASLAAAAFAPSTVVASSAQYEGNSADGAVAFFSTEVRLVPGDTDTQRDVYERSIDPGVGDYVTRQISLGPTGGNDAFPAQYYGADEDGTKVFFSTEERLTSSDSDSARDIYLRDLSTNTTTLVSRGDSSCAGEGCGNGSAPAGIVSGGVVASGDKAFFVSDERLSSQDTDSSFDIYVRELGGAGATKLVSVGDPSCAVSGCGNGPFAILGFEGASSDGSKVFFTTEESLESADTDEANDIYVRDLNEETTKLVSVEGTCPGSLNCDPVFGGASRDGSHVLFETNERGSAADTDNFQDVYDWSGGSAATLVSTAATGGNGVFNALYAGVSANGATVYFATKEPLDSVADTDEARDVYARSGGATSLVSRGDPSCAGSGCGNGDLPASFRWVSPDGSSPGVIFSTEEALTAADTDEAIDVYERSGASTTLISKGDSSCAGSGCGNDAFDASFAGASSDAAHVFFTSDEPLAAGDSDASRDVYDRASATTSLVSVGVLPGSGLFGADLAGIAQDGARAFFVTKERLTVDDDFAAEDDVYARSSLGTLLVSVGNDPELEIGPPPPLLSATNPASPGESLAPAILGQAEAGASIKIYTTSNCSGELVATGTAEQLGTAGIAVTVGAGSTTTFRASAEAKGITSPCSSPLAYTQASAPPPPPPPPPPNPEGESSAGGGTAGSDGKPAKTHDGGIAYLTPETRITFGPAAKTRARRPVFRFTDETGQPGTNFICRLDRGRWRPCVPPQKLTRLNRGRHIFAVKAVNAIGDWEAHAQKRTFKVVSG